MKNIIEYKKKSKKICFKDVKDGASFYSSGVLYIKIRKEDLKFYGILPESANAISVLNGGLTHFDYDEEVNEAAREDKMIRN